MTDRERKLALIVGSLVPLVLLFFGITSFTSSYSKNRTKLRSVQNRIDDQIELRQAADLADIRGRYYTEYSLPTDINKSRIQYERYIESLAEGEGIQIRSVKSSAEKKGSYLAPTGRSLVYNQLTYTINGSGTLDQLTGFLHKFYRLNMIQRISMLAITPENVGGSGNEEFVRTGSNKIEMHVDVLSMVQAEEARDFEGEFHEIKKSLDDYNLAILGRNMFGPPNNQPSIRRTTKSLTESMANISYKIDGVDADKDDLLKFELVSCEIAGAELVQRKETDRSATFTCPPQKPGTYKFNVRVTDNGFPNKSVEKECELVVNKKREARTQITKKDPDPPKPTFAGSTAIYGIGVRGEEKTVLIKVRPTNQRIACTINESFELDEKTWTVRDISKTIVVIECEEELLTYNLKGSNFMLDTPMSRKTVVASASASNDKGEPLPVNVASDKTGPEGKN